MKVYFKKSKFEELLQIANTYNRDEIAYIRMTSQEYAATLDELLRNNPSHGIVLSGGKEFMGIKIEVVD